MKLFFYQAGCSDAARIQFAGDNGKLHNVIIDAGHARTFSRFLLNEIKKLTQDGEHFDAWIVSHIHDDHIGGVLAYIDAVQRGELPHTKLQWLYNSPRTSNDVFHQVQSQSSEAKSIRQGDRLAAYLQQTDQVPARDITTDLLSFHLHELEITILSPAPENLKALHQKYSPENKLPLEREENTFISSAVSKSISDYQIPINSFVYENWTEDNSIENASSISMLTEHRKTKILWLADAWPSVIVASLRKMGYTKENPLDCDLVKVSHHGSSSNNSIELYEMIRCNNFLISADGENKYNLPTKECLVTIILHTQRSGTCHLFFTDDNATLRSIFAVDGDSFFANYDVATHFPPTNTAPVIFEFSDND